jgi:hypothetical protein
MEIQEEIEMRTCGKCGDCKPLTDFKKDKKGKSGYSRICLDCNKKAFKIYHSIVKEKQKPQKTIEDQIRILCADLAKIPGDAEVHPMLNHLKQLFIDINNQPTNVFRIDTLGFGTKSSIADSITLSKLPLWLINHGFGMISPEDIRIESDSNDLLITLLDDKKLIRNQITDLRTFLQS